MESYYLELARQVPALLIFSAAMLKIVASFLSHQRQQTKDFKDSLALLTAAIKDAAASCHEFQRKLSEEQVAARASSERALVRTTETIARNNVLLEQFNARAARNPCANFVPIHIKEKS